MAAVSASPALSHGSDLGKQARESRRMLPQPPNNSIGGDAASDARKAGVRRDRVISTKKAAIERSVGTATAAGIAQLLANGSASKAAKPSHEAPTSTSGADTNVNEKNVGQTGNDKASEETKAQSQPQIANRDDSADASRRRLKPRRGRVSGGMNYGASIQNGETVERNRQRGNTSAGYGNMTAGAATHGTNGYQLLSPDNRAFAAQFLNELRSTIMLHETLSRTVAPQPLPHTDANWTNNIYVNNLPPQTSDEELFRIGKTYGKVKSHKAIINPNTGLCKGYGFIMYETLEEAELALQQLPNYGLSASWAKESFTAKLRRMADLTTANVYLSNLPLDFTTAQLEELFAPNHIVSMRLLVDPVTRLPKGVGFVRLENRSVAQKCIDDLHGKILPGQTTPIQVRFADSDAQKLLKQSARAMGGTLDGTKSSGSNDGASLSPYYSASYLPGWQTFAPLNAEHEAMLRNGNKENVSPSANSTQMVLVPQHANPESAHFGLAPSQVLTHNLGQHNMASAAYLSSPAFAASGGYRVPPNLVAHSPMLHPSPLSLSPSNVPSSVYRPQYETGHVAQHEAGTAGPSAVSQHAYRSDRSATTSDPQMVEFLRRAGANGHSGTLPPSWAQQALKPSGGRSLVGPMHPLSSTPVRLSVSIPATNSTSHSRNENMQSQGTRVAPQITPSVSSASSNACANGAFSRSESAASLHDSATSHKDKSHSQLQASSNKGKEREVVANSTRSSAESFKTGRENGSRESTDEGSDSLEVYCGAQAPISLHCPRPPSHDDESGSLSKTDSGKDVDQRSVTDAATSIYERDSPNMDLAGREDAGKGKLADRTNLDPKAPDGIAYAEYVSGAPLEQMPLSEPATIVPE